MKSRSEQSCESGELDRSHDLTGNPASKPHKQTWKQRLLKVLPCLRSDSSSSSSQRNAVEDAEVSTVSYRPQGLDQLVQQTSFSRKELQVLYQGFKHECPNGMVDEDTFRSIYSQFFPQGDSSSYARFLFKAFDSNNSGVVSFQDFTVSLSVLLRGSVREKLVWTFNLYDVDGDGCISREEMTDIIQSIYDMMGTQTSPQMKDSAPWEHVHSFFQKMDRNNDGVVTLQEFQETCQKDENIVQSMRMFEDVI